MIAKLSRERGSKRTLKIKQCERKNEHTTRNFLKEEIREESGQWKLTKRDAKRRNEEPKSFSKRRCLARKRWIYKCLESLILAQDERWRRA